MLVTTINVFLLPAVIFLGAAGILASPMNTKPASPSDLDKDDHWRGKTGRPPAGFHWAPKTDWDTAVEKGKQIWGQLQLALKSEPKDKASDGMDALQANKWTITGHTNVPMPTSMKEIYQQLGLNWHRPYYTEQIATHQCPRKHNPSFKFSCYTNIYSPADGVIIAANNEKSEWETTHWSEVTFELYKAAAGPGGNVANLRFVIRQSVMNTDTQLIIHEIYTASGHTASAHLQSWTIKGNPTAFFALLGTQNGKGVGRMLTDYTRSFDRKTIQEILTAESSDGDIHIIFRIGPADQSFVSQSKSPTATAGLYKGMVSDNYHSRVGLFTPRPPGLMPEAKRTSYLDQRSSRSSIKSFRLGQSIISTKNSEEPLSSPSPYELSRS